MEVIMPEPLSEEWLSVLRREHRYCEDEARCWAIALTHEIDRLTDECNRDQRLITDLQAQVGRVEGRIPCARCGRPILPYDSQTPGNEEMDVCGRCALAVAREALGEEIDQLRRALSGHLFDGESLDAREAVRRELILQGFAAMEQVARLKAEIADCDTEAQNLRAERDTLQAQVAAIRVIAFDPDTISALERGVVGLDLNGITTSEAIGYAVDALRDIRAALNGDAP